jgi:hypothetical protein
MLTKKKRIVLMLAPVLVFFVLCLLFDGETVDPVGSSMKAGDMERFINTIKSIEAEVVDLTWTHELLRSVEFVQIYNTPQQYTEYVVDFMSQERFTDQQKSIAILSMQKLPLHGLVRLHYNLLELLEEGQLKADVFDFAVFPPYDWNTEIAENFENPAVTRLMKRMLSSPAVPSSRKAYIENEILSGRAKETVRDLREMKQIP